MKKGKLIVIEGTDCSGKGTQSDLLYKRLIKDGLNVFKTSFPMYDTPIPLSIPLYSCICEVHPLHFWVCD